MNNIRHDISSGRLENIGSTEACLEFVEWHDKRGLDLMFYSDGDIRELSMTKDEAHCLVVALSALNYVDLEAAKLEGSELLTKSEERREKLKELRSKQLAINPLTQMGSLELLAEDDPQ